MTIEKEAVYIWKDLVKHGKVSIITKALQAKQDRIEALEEVLAMKGKKIDGLVLQLEAEIAVNHSKHQRILELEHLLHGHSDEVLRTVFQKIKRLESALKDIADSLTLTGECRKICEEMIPNALKDIDGIRDLAKKAIGGGNDKGA